MCVCVYFTDVDDMSKLPRTPPRKTKRFANTSPGLSHHYTPQGQEKHRARIPPFSHKELYYSYINTNSYIHLDYIYLKLNLVRHLLIADMFKRRRDCFGWNEIYFVVPMAYYTIFIAHTSDTLFLYEIKNSLQRISFFHLHPPIVYNVYAN